MTLRIRLRTCFLFLTAIAVVLAVSAEVYRESARVDRVARDRSAWRTALTIHSMQRKFVKSEDERLGTDANSKKANRDLLGAAMRISESESFTWTTPFSFRNLLLVTTFVATIVGLASYATRRSAV